MFQIKKLKYGLYVILFKNGYLCPEDNTSSITMLPKLGESVDHFSNFSEVLLYSPLLKKNCFFCYQLKQIHIDSITEYIDSITEFFV